MRLKRLSTVAILALSALALPARAADRATVTGVIHDTDNKPVAKAEVRLLHRDKGEKKLEEVDTTTTDRDGEFKFGKVDDGTYVIVAVKDKLRDRSEITIHDGRDPAALSFTIRPGKEAEEEGTRRSGKRQYVNFVGTVVDKNGDGVKGATVRLLTGDNDEDTDKLTTVDTVTSEAKGRFEFYKVAFGHFVVDVKKGSLHAKKTVTLKDSDGTQSIQIELR